jgi:hypothetical protein
LGLIDLLENNKKLVEIKACYQTFGYFGSIIRITQDFNPNDLDYDESK